MNFRSIVTAPVEQLDFPVEQYIRKKTMKKQAVLHHTASGRGVSGDFRHWLNDPKRIATPVIVGFDGVIHQLYSSLYWGYHLGVKNSSLRARGINNITSKQLNQITAPIEVDSWGQLVHRGGEFYAWPKEFGEDGRGSTVPKERVQFYPNGFKGYEAYEKYTLEQIKTVEELLLYWNFYYGIPLGYDDDIWDVTDRALSGEKGVFTHNSYRSDKRDVHPQPELIEMLKNVESKIDW